MMQKLKLSLSMVIFGTIGVFVRYIPASSVMIALFRGAIGTAATLVIMKAAGRKPDIPAIRRNLLLLTISGAAIGFNWILLFEAYHYTTVATATLCYYMDPVFVALLAPLILKEKLTMKKAGCILLAMFGMLLVSGVWKTQMAAGEEWKGILMGLGAAVLYTAVVFINKFMKDISAAECALVQLGMSSVILLPYALFTERSSGMVMDVRGIVMLLTVGVLHTGIAYWIYFGCVQKLDGQTIALYSYIDPAIAILLSVFFLKEPMTVSGMLGAVLILGSTLLGELEKKPKKTS